jgi:hypothetical protein
MRPAFKIDFWQHPEQTGPVCRPDGHEILRVLESRFLHRTIGLTTLLHYQQHPDERPEIFQSIHLCGWLDVIYGPYGERMFVPTLTPQNIIHWMDLNSGFNCLDFTALRRHV